MWKYKTVILFGDAGMEFNHVGIEEEVVAPWLQEVFRSESVVTATWSSNSNLVGNLFLLWQPDDGG